MKNLEQSRQRISPLAGMMWIGLALLAQACPSGSTHVSKTKTNAPCKLPDGTRITDNSCCVNGKLIVLDAATTCPASDAGHAAVTSTAVQFASSADGTSQQLAAAEHLLSDSATPNGIGGTQNGLGQPQTAAAIAGPDKSIDGNRADRASATPTDNGLALKMPQALRVGGASAPGSSGGSGSGFGGSGSASTGTAPGSAAVDAGPQTARLGTGADSTYSQGGGSGAGGGANGAGSYGSGENALSMSAGDSAGSGGDGASGSNFESASEKAIAGQLVPEGTLFERVAKEYHALARKWELSKAAPAIASSPRKPASVVARSGSAK